MEGRETDETKFKENHMNIWLISFVACATLGVAQETPEVTWFTHYEHPLRWILVSQASFSKHKIFVKKTEIEPNEFESKIFLDDSTALEFGKTEAPMIKSFVLSPDKACLAFQVRKKLAGMTSGHSKVTILTYLPREKKWQSKGVLSNITLVEGDLSFGSLAGISNDQEKFLFRIDSHESERTTDEESASWVIKKSDGTTLRRGLNLDPTFGNSNTPSTDWEVSRDQKGRPQRAVRKIGQRIVTWTESATQVSSVLIDSMVAMQVYPPLSIHFHNLVFSGQADVVAAIVNDKTGVGLYSNVLISDFSESSNNYQAHEHLKRAELPQGIVEISDLGSILWPSKNLLLRVRHQDKEPSGAYNSNFGPGYSREEWGIWNPQGIKLCSGIPDVMLMGDPK